MYKTNTGSYYSQGRIYTRRELSTELKELNLNRISFSLTFLYNLTSTPVYICYKGNGKVAYSNNKFPANDGIGELLIPDVYHILIVNNQYFYNKLSIRELVHIADIPYSYVEKHWSYSPSHTSHKRYTWKRPKRGALRRFYSKALDDHDVLMRHQSRYTKFKSKYVGVFDWDGLETQASSGWKSHKYRHQWEHNL
mgnify:CR=1 FL=1